MIQKQRKWASRTEIHSNRKTTGAFLLLVTVFLVCVGAGAFASHSPWWIWASLTPVAIGVGWLARGFIRNTPALRLEAGELVIPRLLRPIRIPRHCVRTARIARYSSTSGECVFLEVALTKVPRELARWRDTVTKRLTVQLGRQFDYRPPAEPFLIFQISPLNISDEEFSQTMAAQAIAAAPIPRQ